VHNKIHEYSFKATAILNKLVLVMRFMSY